MNVRQLVAAVAGAIVLIPQPGATALPGGAALDRADRALAGSAGTAAALARTAAARDVLRILDAGGRDIETAAAVAQRVTAVHATDLGVRLPAATPAAPSGSPSEAALALAARHGVVPTAAQRADLAGLDRLAEPARGALSGFLDAFLAFDGATRTAYAHVDRAAVAALERRLATGADPEAHEAVTPADLGVDLGAVLAARGPLLAAAARLRAAIAGSVLSADVSLCPAVAIDLTSGDDTYVANCALVVDTLGDDTYLNNAGAGCLGAAALLDVDGNDTYGDGTRNCTGGAGVAGAGLLVDTDGDDAYTGAAGANGGGGVGGAGLLVDTDGADRYSAVDVASGGAVAGGAGLLVDLDGSDAHRGRTATNGGAILGGAGALVDADGSDSHAAGGIASNGGAAVGTGFLLDVRGNDTYHAEYHVSNGGGFVGTGFLLDLLGDDTYDSPATLTNGAGGLGVGVLVDGGGVDTYRSAIGGNGSGAFGFGLLLDCGGTGDTYDDGTAASGTDVTAAPKAAAGAQVDVP